jgi:hypothetical protein
MESEIVCDITALSELRNPWDELRLQSEPATALYEDYRSLFESPTCRGKMRLVVVREHGKVVCLAPFFLSRTQKRYTLGERKLFDLPVRSLRLVGGSFLGDIVAERVRKVFSTLRLCREFDLIRLPELPIAGRFYGVVESVLAGSSWRRISTPNRPGIHWLIDLPGSFDEYLSSLGGKTRQTLRRKMRKFDELYQGRVRRVTTPEDVDWFLTVGERISRTTYQWNVGQQLRNDEATRERYVRNARTGRLRCYVLMAGDEPCAFLRGTLRDGVFDYETPGYLSTYARESPGTVLLLRAIEDLISEPDCCVFDFGTGGDEIGYKSLFGNRSYEAAPLEIVHKLKPYSMILCGIENILTTFKIAAKVILGNGKLKQAIKRRIRVYGSGT